MAHWLLKSEPDEFGWTDLVARGATGEDWTGVRNYHARNNMRAMAVGDLGFFYHSNIGKEIVGILEVIRTAAPDPTADDSGWDCVRVKARRPLSRPVTLQICKATEGLSEMALVLRPRLSVQPVSDKEWAIVCRLAEVET